MYSGRTGCLRAAPRQRRFGGLQQLLRLQVGYRCLGRGDVRLGLIELRAKRRIVDLHQGLAFLHPLEIADRDPADAPGHLGRERVRSACRRRRRSTAPPTPTQRFQLIMTTAARLPASRTASRRGAWVRRWRMPGHGAGLSARWRDASTPSLMLPSVGSRCGQPISCRKAGLVNPSSWPRRDSPRGAGRGDSEPDSGWIDRGRSPARWRQRRARSSPAVARLIALPGSRLAPMPRVKPREKPSENPCRR